jgi:type VI protein secretion system component Hcp
MMNSAEDTARHPARRLRSRRILLRWAVTPLTVAVAFALVLVLQPATRPGAVKHPLTPQAAGYNVYVVFNERSGAPIRLTGMPAYSEVASVGYGLGTPVAVNSSGLSIGRTTSKDVVITKAMDDATTGLTTAATSGYIFQDVTIVWMARPSNGLGIVVMQYTFSNAAISAYKLGDPSDSRLETLTLTFACLRADYIPLNKDGTAGRKTVAQWSVAKGTMDCPIGRLPKLP